MPIKIGGIAFAIAALPLLAGAQTSGENIDRRQAEQKQAIDAGVKKGELTSQEAARLRQSQQKIEKMENDARADGKISAREAREIERAQEREKNRIIQERRDRQKTAPQAQQLPQSSSTKVVMGRYPISGSVSQGFGVPWSENPDKTHTGVDIPAGAGTVVRSMTTGKVALVGNLGDEWGNYVIVEESSGAAKGYLHVVPSVAVGTAVNPGDEIGKVYKDHLHYNVCSTKSLCQRGALPTIKKDPKFPNDPLFKDGPFLRP